MEWIIIDQNKMDYFIGYSSKKILRNVKHCVLILEAFLSMFQSVSFRPIIFCDMHRQ